MTFFSKFGERSLWQGRNGWGAPPSLGTPSLGGPQLSLACDILLPGANYEINSSVGPFSIVTALKDREESMMRTNRRSAPELEHRSTMATRLRAAPAPDSTDVKKIPFPSGLAPKPKPMDPKPGPNDSLPHCDVIAMMDTAAEARAMANVLTPGQDVEDWYVYAKNFEKDFLPQIGPRGPSRRSKRLGSYFPIDIGGLRVLIYKTELHMHEDAIKLPNGSYSLPIKDMFKQMIGDARPRVFLTTGTSGGVYCDMNLGDVVVTRAARFMCERDFNDAPFNNKTFHSNWTIPTKFTGAATKMMHNFASKLTNKTKPPDAHCSCGAKTLNPRIHYDGKSGIPEFHPILTTDFFEFGTSTNHLDKLGMAVEMDDAALGLACSELNAPPHWACVRNLSDPTINGTLDHKMQGDCAEYFYKEFGYWTTVMSALTTWSIIAGLAKQK
ncbi:MAG: 5'-methylthioadenosine/S-adenosylhomocysteine nucleosidase [Acidobacteria bacterium]|nr:5'-methylthioadenosine/S-adenosylhomocysteine nucleosidase [Acidobacteriota bacterium]